MDPIRFTLLACLLAIVVTIIAALLAPSAPANRRGSPAANQAQWERLDQPAAGGPAEGQAAPADCSPNCFP